MRSLLVHIPQPFLIKKGSSPFIVFYAFFGLSPVCPCLSCTEEARTKHSSPGVASPVLIRREGALPLTRWQHSTCSPRRHWPPLWGKHIDLWYPPGAPGSYAAKLCFPSSQAASYDIPAGIRVVKMPHEDQSLQMGGCPWKASCTFSSWSGHAQQSLTTLSLTLFTP